MPKRICVLLLGFLLPAAAAAPPLIFDTDIGNDVDDALALAAIHALESRGECRLVAVTITKDNRWAAPFISLMNHFYGRANIPIGVVQSGKTPQDGNFLRQVLEMKDAQGGLLYPRALSGQDPVPDAVLVLRQALAKEADGSVVIVQVGFSSNLARLLDSKADRISPLDGRELAARKVRLLSIMGGHFQDPRFTEYNIKIDVPAARKLLAEWPGEVVLSGFEIGNTIQYDPARLDTDFLWTPNHPVVHAYRFYRKMPYREPLWDPTAVLYAVRPNAGYFSLSEPGRVLVKDAGETVFEPVPQGRHRYLMVNDAQRAAVREAISLLVSQPR